MQWIKILGFSMIVIMLLTVAVALSQLSAPEVQLQQAPISHTPVSSVALASPKCVVAGCSGEICTEESEAKNIVTTCEYKSAYGCYKTAVCERQKNGHCEWTQTPELSACLKHPSQAASQGASPNLVF